MDRLHEITPTKETQELCIRVGEMDNASSIINVNVKVVNDIINKLYQHINQELMNQGVINFNSNTDFADNPSEIDAEALISGEYPLESQQDIRGVIPSKVMEDANQNIIDTSFCLIALGIRIGRKLEQEDIKKVLQQMNINLP